ncbi:hypothetical protein IG631_11959 [Alternaria alternata]|nr:hypothetical protein IG631_11959 [Alternaria alternata]
MFRHPKLDVHALDIGKRMFPSDRKERQRRDLQEEHRSWKSAAPVAWSLGLPAARDLKLGMWLSDPRCR